MIDKSTIAQLRVRKGFSVYEIETQLCLCLWHIVIFIFLFTSYEKSIYGIHNFQKPIIYGIWKNIYIFVFVCFCLWHIALFIFLFMTCKEPHL